MGASNAIQFQHLIDPEDCARCGSCESECPLKAISHDQRNYVVDASICEKCLRCLAVCSSGAIDAWLPMADGRGYTLDEQLAWDELPQKPLLSADAAVQQSFSNVALALAEAVTHAAPASAAVPQVHLFNMHAPAVATLRENRRLTTVNDVHHLVLDFGSTVLPVLEGQTIGILAPGTDAQGRPHAMRAYSIASARDGELAGSNTVALTVKRIREETAQGSVYGVCSNYLCDLEVGAPINVVGPYGQHFLMPNHDGAKLLMISTGTGIAPMRGMIARRQRIVGADADRADSAADLTLFYGARSTDEMPYFDELFALPESFIDLNLAFSRVQGRSRQYVQDAILQRGERVLELLRDEQCYIYLCGVKGMEEGVEQAFAEICRQYGVDWPQLKQQLHKQSRFHIETY